MRDIISATLGSDHFLKCQTYTIARNGEGLTPCLSVAIPENLSKYWAYIDFKKPNNETFKTPRIDVVEGVIEYNIPCAVLDVDGKLRLQIVFQNENNEIWKSYVKEFVVRESINAVDDIPDKEDFISEAQKLLDSMTPQAVDVAKRTTIINNFLQKNYSGKAIYKNYSLYTLETSELICDIMAQFPISQNDIFDIEWEYKDEEYTLVSLKRGAYLTLNDTVDSVTEFDYSPISSMGVFEHSKHYDSRLDEISHDINNKADISYVDNMIGEALEGDY